MKAKVKIDIKNTQKLIGENVLNSKKKMHQLKGVFADEESFVKTDQEQLVYEVQSYMPVTEGLPGGLFFGVSTIMPGKVGNEYFMTRGHFHAQPDRAEFYWGIQGKGMLILMDRDRNTWTEDVHPGSLHYIGGHIAHRLANTGEENLIVGACWPSDAGHDYEEITINGFSARLVEKEGKAILINNP